MKKYLFMLMFALVTLTYSNQNFLTVDQIRNEYELIKENMDKYEKVIVEDLNNNIPGTIGYYYENKQLKVIVADYSGDNGKEHEEIYFSANFPLFVYKEKQIYNASIKDKKYNEKRTKKHQERYYFDSNKSLIRYTDEKGKIITNDEKLQDFFIRYKKRDGSL